MTNKTILYLGLAVLALSLLTFAGSLLYVFAPLFARESAGIGSISMTYVIFPIFGILFGLVLTIIGFFKSRTKKNLP